MVGVSMGKDSMKKKHLSWEDIERAGFTRQDLADIREEMRYDEPEEE